MEVGGRTSFNIVLVEEATAVDEVVVVGYGTQKKVNLTGAIATVDVSPSKGVEIYLEDREMRLSLAPDDWEGNLSRLGVAIGDLARRRELGMVQEARAADGSVWVSLRQQLR